MEADIGYKPSYLWKSLMAAKDLVVEGMAWRIGNGKKVLIMHDRWIGMTEAVQTTSAFPEDMHHAKVEKSD